MKGSAKGAKDPEDYENQFLHQTIGGSRIRAAGATASSVSSYLENLPSITLDNTTPPPRPPRPPGGLLGISNGRGMGYGRSLGSSYDSPLATHGSFNGHVRSGANLYGGRTLNSTGLSPTKSASGGHHRPSMSVFPIQKALEIAMKESRLLAAASSRGGSGTSGTGMSTGITFVRELRKARHARGAIITEHGPTPDISLDEAEEGDMQTDSAAYQSSSNSATGSRVEAAEQLQDEPMGNFETRTTARFFNVSTGSHSNGTTVPEAGDIRIQRPAVTATDTKGAYPGIAHLPHTTLTAQSGAVALHYPRSLRNVLLPSRPWQPSSESYAALASTSIPTIHSSASSSNIASQDSIFISSTFSTSASTSSSASSSTLSTSTPYQPHFSLSSSSSTTSSFSSAPIWSTKPKSSNNVSGSSSSHSAVHAVRELLDSYPAPSPYCVDDKKRSPLHFAAASGDLELVEFLLERGVRPDCGRDIAGNMPLHLAIISNRIDVVAALLKAGADMTLASPMTHKTPLDLAESRLSYLLSRAQDSVQDSSRYSTGSMDLHTSHSNNQIATRSSFHMPPAQSPALLYQIKGIVNLLRPYVVRQQKLQHGERQKERQKERSWDRADKYMRQHPQDGSSSNGLWQSEPQSDDHYGDMEDEDEDDDEGDDDDDDMDTGEGNRRSLRKRLPLFRQEGYLDEDELPSYTSRSKKLGRRLNRRMDADETEVALESLMNGLSLLEANRKQQEQRQLQQQQQMQDSAGASTSGSIGMPLGMNSSIGGISEIGDGNLADSELDPRSEQDVDEALPDLLEQVQQVLQAIKLNEHKGT
ncbi:hypothetical protein BGX33_008400 [Mortierella sp. NVP41]|nr:hypothetical protein BGX33_008400 [Mortierella sp. NVP41]